MMRSATVSVHQICNRDRGHTCDRRMRAISLHRLLAAALQKDYSVKSYQ
jgi:hypothetical protein